MSVNDVYTKSASFFTATHKTAMLCKPCTTDSYVKTSQPVQTLDIDNLAHIIPINNVDFSIHNIPSSSPHLIVNELDMYHKHSLRGNLIEDYDEDLGIEKTHILMTHKNCHSYQPADGVV